MSDAETPEQGPEGWGSAGSGGGDVAGPPSSGPGPVGPLPAPPGPPPDPNAVAVERAGLEPAFGDWMRQVAGQVDARLDRVSDTWRTSPQADAARACAFGLLLGQLAALYPHARPAVHRVAEAHPSFTTLASGNRLATLQEIAGDPDRMAAWLGPLVGATDAQRVRRLLD